MVATDKVFAGSIPEIYDRLMVPLIFEPYAQDLAERIARIEPRSILETAAGTGGPDAGNRPRGFPCRHGLWRPISIKRCSTTPRRSNPSGMASPGNGRMRWPCRSRMEDSMSLRAQFGAMFFPDKVKGYSEARRVLKTGGHFFLAVWDRISDNEFADVVTEALAAFFPQDPPLFMARPRLTAITMSKRFAGN